MNGAEPKMNGAEASMDDTEMFQNMINTPLCKILNNRCRASMGKDKVLCAEMKKMCTRR